MNLADLPFSLRALSPELLLIGGGLGLAVLSGRAGSHRSAKGNRHVAMPLVAMAFVALTAGAWLGLVPAGEAFGGRLVSSDMTRIVGLAILGGTFLVLMAAAGQAATELVGRRIPLLLWIVAATLLLLRAQDLVPLGVALAAASLGFAGWPERDERARQKSFQRSAMAMAVVFFATAMVYGETGATELDAIAGAFAVGLTGSTALATLGLVLLLTAVAWRTGLVPFHRGAIESIQRRAGVGSPVVLFVASLLRILGLLLIARLLPIAVPAEDLPRTQIVLVLGAASMMLGALVAVARKDLPGTFGYLLLAHLGMALLPMASPAVPLRGAIYAAATILAATIAVAIALQRLAPRADFTGAGRRRPLAAGALLLSLAALSGMPGTSGFGCAWSAGQWALQEGLPFLAAGVLASCSLGLFLTLRIGRDLFLEGRGSSGETAPSSLVLRPAPGSSLALLGAASALLAGGGVFLLRLL